MGASNNKSPSQLRRDNQIKEEKIIANIRGATSYKISSNASSEDKLYDIIDRSFPLDDRLRIRAKQTVEGLSEAEQDDLLINVMLDGPNAYFSREANEQRAYNLFFGREDVRLYPNATLPGEGIARQASSSLIGSSDEVELVSYTDKNDAWVPQRWKQDEWPENVLTREDGIIGNAAFGWSVSGNVGIAYDKEGNATLAKGITLGGGAIKFASGGYRIETDCPLEIWTNKKTQVSSAGGMLGIGGYSKLIIKGSDGNMYSGHMIILGYGLGFNAESNAWWKDQ